MTGTGLLGRRRGAEPERGAHARDGEDRRSHPPILTALAAARKARRTPTNSDHRRFEPAQGRPTTARHPRYKADSGVRWIRSYVVSEEDGALGTFCIYEADGPEAIRAHAEASGLPVDEIVPVADTVIVRDDPVPASA